MLNNETKPDKPDIILRLPEVTARTGLPRSTIYYYMNRNTFPDTIKLGARSIGWFESEIQEWIDSRKGGSVNEKI